MGFWRWLFSMETEEEREARRLRLMIEAQQRETEIRDYYTDLVRDLVENGDEFGYTIECMSIYEQTILAAIKIYTRQHYIVLRDTREELEWKGKARITVHYIKEPHQPKNHEDPTI
jgi:hypothetical protein